MKKAPLPPITNPPSEQYYESPHQTVYQSGPDTYIVAYVEP